MAPKIGIMLSGCGVYDGSEVHEAAFTLLAVDQNDAEAVFIAPDIAQLHVIDHTKGQPEPGASRSVLAESARIARGAIQPAADVHAADLDALVFPGGFGAAKNLCTFAVDGPDCRVDPEVARLIGEMQAAGKPLGFACIAPAIAAKVIGNGVRLTIGSDADTAAALEKMGAVHVVSPVDQAVVDEERKVVSAPAYMVGDARPKDICAGIAAMVAKVLDLVD